MQDNQILRARIKAIEDLLKEHGKNEEYNRLLSNGFIPEPLQAEFSELVSGLAEHMSSDPLSDLELATYSTFLYAHPENVVGVEVPGSGFINPVITKGNIMDLDKLIPSHESEPIKMEEYNYNNPIKLEEVRIIYANRQSEPYASHSLRFEWNGNFYDYKYSAGKTSGSSKIEKYKSEDDMIKNLSKAIDSEIIYNTWNSEQTTKEGNFIEYSIMKWDKESLYNPAPIIEPADQFSLMITRKIAESKQHKEPVSEGVYSVQESIDIYNTGISDDEIRAWVYYKRLFGNPMKGWDKYYLTSDKNKFNILLVAEQVTDVFDNHFRFIRKIPQGTVIGSKTKFTNEYDKETYLICRTEANELVYVPKSKVKEQQSTSEVSQEEIDQLVKNKALCCHREYYLPIPIYTFGNIYEIEDQLLGTYDREAQRRSGGEYEKILERYGKEIADWHTELIEDAKKRKGELIFQDPRVSHRPFLSTNSDLASNVELFHISELNEETGVNFKEYFNNKYSRRSKNRYQEGDSYSLVEAFNIWFEVTVNDTMLQNTTKNDVLDLFFKSGKLSDDLTEKEKDEKRLTARLEGERLFSEFLATALIQPDIFLLNNIWNRQYNAFSKLNYTKIPIGFEVNKNVFSISDFKLKKAQSDGISFTALTNGGCLAYDIGYGKTLTNIFNLSALLSQGKIKRPLIAVPKPVYNNWIREMFGFWTDGETKSFDQFENSSFINGALTGTKYKLNSWFNLNDKINFKNELIPENTITIVTYEGLRKIGFSASVNDDLLADLAEIIITGTSGKTGREKEKDIQKLNELLGKANMESLLDIDLCGFDHLSFDEAHNFKNIFGSIPTDKEHKNIWRIPNKKPSSRGIKAMLLSLYVQKKFGGNIVLLTATPFTNSPLEIFSMMSLCGFEMLKKFNYQNLYEFVETFIETQVEYTVNYLNEIELQTVIKSFKNKNILRELIYKLFDYKDDPKEAGIKRPCKINFPNNKVSTYLTMSLKQQEVQMMVKEQAALYDPKYNRGAIGKALAMAKNNALSPCIALGMPDDLEEFINDSPKIKYVVECIRTVKEWHESRNEEMSGQVIYSNRGVALFSSIKQYMEEELGFRSRVKFGDEVVDEIELITGGGGEDEIYRKEVIKDAFNKGYVKIIIGTGTIKEGVNLQERGTVLYDIDLDWNPTDFRQLGGRIHRQGNTFGYVRVVVPLVQNTLDSFIFQKLDEKSKRISSIWDKDNDSNTLEDYVQVDPAEIKMELIDDIDELVKMYYDKEKRTASRSLKITEENQKAIYEIDEKLYNFKDAEKNLIEDLQHNNMPSMLRYKKKINEFIEKNITARTSEKTRTDFDELRSKVEEVYQGLVAFFDNRDYKEFFETLRKMKSRKYTVLYDGTEFRWEGYTNPFSVSDYYKNGMVSYYSDLKKIERVVLMPNGLTIDSDLSPLKTRMDEEFNKSKSYIDYLDSDEYKLKLAREIKAKLDAKAEKRGDIQDRVNQFAATNYLLSYPFKGTDVDECNIPTIAYGGSIHDNVLTEPENSDSLVPVGSDIEDTKAPLKKADPKEELRNKLKYIKPFMQKDQVVIVSKALEEFSEVINRLYDVIQKMPKTYEADEIPSGDQIVWLHYFTGSADWYIIEKDKENEQLQAFGYANMFDGPEAGYISIVDLAKNAHVNLDFHWEPKKWSEINKKEEPVRIATFEDIGEVQQAIDLLADLLPDTEAQEAIGLLKDLQ